MSIGVAAHRDKAENIGLSTIVREAIRRKLVHCYQRRWLPRNDAQIRRELDSNMKPSKRRKTMKLQQGGDSAVPVGIPPRVDPHSRSVEYVQFCRVGV